MALPEAFAARLKLPAIAAPMFLISGPDLVVEVCKAGLVGTFPALNQRTTEGYEDWLDEIEGRLPTDAAPYGVNLVVHRSNPRLEADLEVTVRRRVPLVITSLGVSEDVIRAVQSYGGLVFHDVISDRHARKAAGAGVDGLILVSAGAGGHTGPLNPLAFVEEVASFFAGTIILSGSIATGRQIAAARVMGADMGYIGTGFISAAESLAPEGYKDMVVASQAADVLATPHLTGVNANFLRPSMVAAGLDPEALGPKDSGLQVTDDNLAWKKVWSAGHGVGAVRAREPAAQICARLIAEYGAAMRKACGDRYV